MRNLYFDIDKISRIMNHFEDDPYNTITRFEQYLEEYPKDYSIYPYYCSELIKIGEFKKAETILNKITDEYMNDKNYIMLDKKDIFESNLILSKIKLFSYTKRYKECLSLAKKNIEFMFNHDIPLNRLILYCEKKLGILNEESINKDNFCYSYNQIINYSEENFLEHIKRHLYDNYINDLDNTELDSNDQSIFYEDFKLDEVFKIIKEQTPNKNGLNSGTFENFYYYKYDGCGAVHGKTVDYFTVVAMNDTCEFITMYPSNIGPRVPYYDLNYLLAEDNNKTLTKSRVDKFNEKYGNYIDKK